MLPAFVAHSLFHNLIVFRQRTPSPITGRHQIIDSLIPLSSCSVGSDCSYTSNSRFFKDLEPLPVDYVPVWEKDPELFLFGVMDSLVDECTTVKNTIAIDSHIVT